MFKFKINDKVYIFLEDPFYDQPPVKCIFYVHGYCEMGGKTFYDLKISEDSEYPKMFRVPASRVYAVE